MTKVLLVLGLLVGGTVGAEPVLRVQVDPHVALAPGAVRVIVHLVLHPANEYVVVSCESVTRYASSVQRSRADTSTLAPIWFRALPAGDYVILAALYRTQPDGGVAEAGRAVEHVIVAGDAP